MGRVTNTLLARLHSVFDKDPEKALALRVRHADGAAWSISNYVLTLTAQSLTHEWDLREYSIGSLANAIEAAGYELVYRNEGIDHLDAAILMEGARHEDQSNGDHLYACASVLQTVIGAIGLSDEEAKAAIPIVLDQLNLPRSTVEWADLFGEIFGIPRWDGESDEDYTARIIEEVKRSRSNPAAILRNIQRITGEDLELREPWKEIFLLNQHALSGNFHLQGAPIYEYHRAQLVAKHGPDWSKILPEAEADRPAGTIFLPPATHPGPFEIDLSNWQLLSGRNDQWAEALYVNRFGRLSVDLSLSNYVPSPPIHTALISTLLFTNAGLRGPYDETGSGTGWTGTWDQRKWAPRERVAELYPPKEYSRAVEMADDIPGAGILSDNLALSGYSPMPLRLTWPLLEHRVHKGIIRVQHPGRFSGDLALSDIAPPPANRMYPPREYTE